MPRFTKVQVAEIRKYHQGSSVFLGEPDAERDVPASPSWVDAIYVESPSTKKVVHGKARIVIGRKGAGKSATRLAARAIHERSGKDAPYTVQASADAIFTQHVQALAADGDLNSVHVWHKAFAFQFLKEFAKDLAGKALTDAAEVTLRKWALAEGFVARDFGERIIEGAKKMIPKVRKHLKGKDDSLSGKLSEEHIAEILADRNAVLYIDDFDNFYAPGKGTTGIKHIRAALEAADRLSSAQGPTVTLLLREDLWLHCRHGWNYLDKVSGLVDLQWSTDELRSFIEKRLRAAAAEALSMTSGEVGQVAFDELWALFFPERITLEDEKDSTGFGYILRRTLYTPRDLHKFLVRVADVTHKWPASQDDIEKAELSYSRDRTEYLINEFGTLCVGLETCLYSFAGKPLEWKAQDLYKHLAGLVGTGDVRLVDAMIEGDTERALARFLFRIGFLEVRYYEADHKRFEVRDALRYPDHWKGIRSDDSVRWAVRSAFYRTLQRHARDPVAADRGTGERTKTGAARRY